MSYRFVDSFQAGSGWNWFSSVAGGVYHCYVYSEKLLMMDTGTV
jgi:hypothetical protein